MQLERTVSNATSRTAPVNLIYLTSDHPSVGYGGFGTAITHYSRTYQNSTKTEQSKIAFTQQGDSVSTSGSTIDFYTKTLSTGSAAPEIRMRVNYNGNVGINTTNPVFKTHIRGGSGTEETVLKIDKSSAADSGGHTTIVGLGCESAGWAKAGIAFERTGAYDTGKMHFLMYPTGLNTSSVGLSNSVMTINNDGNVGIGTTSPGAKLDVKTATAPFTALKSK